MRTILAERQRRIGELESRLELEHAEAIGAAKTIAKMGTEIARLREHSPEVSESKLDSMTAERDVAIEEIDRLRAVNNQLAHAQRGKLILAEVDCREPKNPRLLVLVAPDTPDEVAATLILQHLGPALGVDPRRVVQQIRRTPPHSQETAEEAAARDGEGVEAAE
jgi:hypothetical protein